VVGNSTQTNRKKTQHLQQQRSNTMAIDPFDNYLKITAKAELVGRMDVIAKDVARRKEDTAALQDRIASNNSAIIELTRLHNEYQTIVGTSK
jgi:hypothetical protein